MVQDKEMRLEYVNTKEKIADIFTKDLPKEDHDIPVEKIITDEDIFIKA